MDFALEFLGMSRTLRECLEQQEAQLLPLYEAKAEGASNGSVPQAWTKSSA